MQMSRGKCPASACHHLTKNLLYSIDFNGPQITVNYDAGARRSPGPAVRPSMRSLFDFGEQCGSVRPGASPQSEAQTSGPSFDPTHNHGPAFDMAVRHSNLGMVSV